MNYKKTQMSLEYFYTNYDSVKRLFMSSFIPVPESGCWLWTREWSSHGYAVVLHNYHREYGHRISCFLSGRSIPDDMSVDHLCRVKCCVNPDHLEVVTPGENTLRGFSTSAIHKRKTHCVNGHPFEGDNIQRVVSRPRTRICRECKNERDRKYWRKRYYDVREM